MRSDHTEPKKIKKKNMSIFQRLYLFEIQFRFECELKPEYDEFDLMRVLNVKTEAREGRKTNIWEAIPIKDYSTKWTVGEKTWKYDSPVFIYHSFNAYEDVGENFSRLFTLLNNKEWKQTATKISYYSDAGSFPEDVKEHFQTCPKLLCVTTDYPYPIKLKQYFKYNPKVLFINEKSKDCALHQFQKALQSIWVLLHYRQMKLPLDLLRHTFSFLTQ